MKIIDEGVEDIVHPMILRVADEFLRDWRWAQLKRFFLLRYRGQDIKAATPELQSHLLVRLPDQLFCLTIDFLRPRDFHATMFKELSSLLTECERLHVCVKQSLVAACSGLIDSVPKTKASTTN